MVFLVRACDARASFCMCMRGYVRARGCIDQTRRSGSNTNNLLPQHCTLKDSFEEASSEGGGGGY
jgi:hypothetical protein